MTIRELINSTIQFYHDYLYTVTNQNILDWSISYIFLTLILLIVGFVALMVCLIFAGAFYVDVIAPPLNKIYEYGNRIVKTLHRVTGSQKLLSFLEKHLGNALGGLIWGILVFFGMYLVAVGVAVIAVKS